MHNPLLVNINAYTYGWRPTAIQVYQTFPLSHILASALLWLIKSNILKFLWLYLVNISGYANFYQNIPYGRRLVTISISHFRPYLSQWKAISCRYLSVCQKLSKYSQGFKHFGHFHWPWTDRQITRGLQGTLQVNFSIGGLFCVSTFLCVMQTLDLVGLKILTVQHQTCNNAQTQSDCAMKQLIYKLFLTTKKKHSET